MFQVQGPHEEKPRLDGLKFQGNIRNQMRGSWSGKRNRSKAIRQGTFQSWSESLRRLLEQLVDPRLKHLAELLVEDVADVVAGAGACLLHAGTRGAATGACLLCGGARAVADSRCAAVLACRGLARCAAVFARPLLLLAAGSCLATLRLRDVCPAPWPEMALASDFVLDFARLLTDEELDLPSSSLDLVPVEGLMDGLAVVVPPPVVGRAPALPGVDGLVLQERTAGKRTLPRGRDLPLSTASVSAANTTTALPVGRMRMGTSIVDMGGCSCSYARRRAWDVTQITFRRLGRDKVEPGPTAMNQFGLATSGLPLASLISAAHSLWIAPTTLSGIGT